MRRLILHAILTLIAFYTPLCVSAQSFYESSAGYPEDSENIESVEDTELKEYQRFWSLDFGPSFPIGSSESFYLPTNIIPEPSPKPFADYYREGYTMSLATGVMTDLGFEASISFRITKVNFNNQATAQIITDTRNQLRETTYSSYLLGTQIYLGQRMKPLYQREESLYFGVGFELGAVKHYSERFSTPNDETFAVSIIAGDEIPLQRDPEGSSMVVLRIQTEFVALASQERPRFFHLTFGIRSYLP